MRKRILIIDATTPTPDQDAGSVQTFMALQACISLGYKAHFVPADNWLYQPEYTGALQAIGVDCAFAPYEIGFENYIQRYGWLFDVILAYRVGTTEKVLPFLKIHAPQAPILFHLADLHYLRMAREARLSGDDELAYAASLMKQRELCICQPNRLARSRIRAWSGDLLAAEAPHARTRSVAADVRAFFGTQSRVLQAPRSVFFGRIHAFAQRGRRRPFREQHSSADQSAGTRDPFHHRRCAPLRGGACPSALPDVVVRGQVADLRDLFDPCRVFVCPLRVGAGVKGQGLRRALSYGIPVVSTQLGVEGTDMAHGKHALVADDPAAFAAAVLRIYRSSALWGRLSKSGQDLVRERFSLQMGKAALASAIETALAHKLGLDGAAATRRRRQMRNLSVSVLL